MASDTLSLMGRHNALNALAALALTACVVGIDGIDDHVLSALRNFRGLPHRMEIVGEIGGVRYINDSKATTVAATLAALEGLTMPTILIAGGDGKKQSFVPLAEAVAQHCRAVLLIGRDAPLIEKALMASDSKVTIENCGTLDQAVRCAKTMARSGDIVLLSPACASLDQFADYLARGIAFTELIGAGEMR
jgi:UDP-N-acetylmuramoylalanine--D-glutamate ligase